MYQGLEIRDNNKTLMSSWYILRGMSPNSKYANKNNNIPCNKSETSTYKKHEQVPLFP